MNADLTGKRIALTGGTGFVGGHLIDALLSEGAHVSVLARNPDKLAERATKIKAESGDIANEMALRAFAKNADIVIHLAALTHALTRDDFHAANVEGASKMAASAARAGALLIHISSMAARAPHLSDYAWSKAESEKAVAAAYGEHAAENAPGWIALRAPAIYGPGDDATLPFFRMVKRGIAAEPMMSPPGRVSILYVGDVVAAILSAVSAKTGGIYEIGDESADGHTWRQIGDALGTAFGKKPHHLPMPRVILDTQAGIVELFARLRGKATFVTRGKIAEFFHPDWVARDQLLAEATGWRPETPLQEGFAKTLRWYQLEGLL